ncbi:hypothetical protein [Sinorhizobium sp. RAC02]|uniref:amidohydrolase family protein n=1 Tax=Sinorhizobium sp. RAC02 TaxID=1842534 RepID=UPI00336C268F
MADILIKNGTVIAIDPERRIIADGAVAITGDRIVAVGPTAEVEAAHPAREVIDARGMAIMPGFVDAHAHAGHGLIKTLGGGKSDPWYQACRGAYTVGSTPEFWFAEAQLAALERLRFGVTTGVSLLGGGDSVMRTDDPIYGDAHMEGVLGIGTRSVVAVGTTRPPHPLAYARWDGEKRTDYPFPSSSSLPPARRSSIAGMAAMMASCTLPCSRRPCTGDIMKPPVRKRRSPSRAWSSSLPRNAASSSRRTATPRAAFASPTRLAFSARAPCCRMPPAWTRKRSRSVPRPAPPSCTIQAPSPLLWRAAR